MEESCRNRTPDKLPASACAPLFAACDAALLQVARTLGTRLAVGIGGFAAARLQRVLAPEGIAVGQILHPSPASPLANRGWAPQASAALRALGVDVPTGSARARKVALGGAALKVAEHAGK